MGQKEEYARAALAHRKMAELVAALFESKAEHAEIDGVRISLLADKAAGGEGELDELLLIRFESFSEASMLAYSDFHRAFVQRRQRCAKRFFLYYDLRQVRVEDAKNPAWVKMIIALHTSLTAEYLQCLRGTLVWVPNRAAEIVINTILSVLYKPVRPVRFASSEANAIKFIRECHAQNLDEMKMLLPDEPRAGEDSADVRSLPAEWLSAIAAP